MLIWANNFWLPKHLLPQYNRITHTASEYIENKSIYFMLYTLFLNIRLTWKRLNVSIVIEVLPIDG